MCYASMALVTDYDSWRDVSEEEHVSIDLSLIHSEPRTLTITN